MRPFPLPFCVTGMKHYCRAVRIAAILIGVGVVSLLASLPNIVAATPLDTNLIANGDAETSAGAANYTDTQAPAGWTTTSNFTAVRYSAGNSDPNAGQLTPTQSATFGGGTAFFAGGPNNADSSASQIIDISDRAAEIDGGGLTVVLSGYFSGPYNQDDAMTLGAQLRNDKGQQYAGTLIGNVRSADHPGVTGLFYRSRTLPVPVGTRSILVTLRSTRANTTQDTYNDGYADSVRLELVNTAGANTWAQSYGVAAVTSPYGGDDYGEGLDYPEVIAAMPDGGVVVYGQISTQTGNNTDHTGYLTRDALIRYGSDGKILWTKFFTNSGSVYQGRRIMTADAQGNIYFAGGFLNNNNNNVPVFPYVVKFDPNGVQLWLTQIKYPRPFLQNDGKNTYANDAFTSIALTPDGKVVAGASATEYFSGNQDLHFPFIVILNGANGTVESAREFDGATNGHVQGFLSQICASSIAGRFAFITNIGPTLVLADTAGNVLATQEALGYSYLNPTVLIGTSDGGYLVAGLNYPIGGSLVRKYAADLSLQWVKRTSLDVRVSSAVQTTDGGYLLGAWVSIDAHLVSPTAGGDAGYKAALVKLDGKGNLSRAYALGGLRGDGGGGSSESETGVFATVTADEGFAFSTPTLSYLNPNDPGGIKADWWTVKTDHLGRVPNFGDLQLDISGSILLSEVTDAPTKGSLFDTSRLLTLENPPGPTSGGDAPSNLVSTDANGTVRVQAQAPFPAPPPPPHGGVSGTNFTVNGNYTAVTQDLHDTFLHFAAQQTSYAAGLGVRVQATQTPATEASWTDLPTGNGGFMSYNASTQQFLLSTTNYPLQNGIYFRAIAAAPFYPDSISNAVGPFNLATNQNHLGPTKLYITNNGPVANIRFGVTETTIPNGIAVRVQASNTPASEASWTDAPIGSSGHLIQDPDHPNEFYLGSDDYPSGSDVYFRAIASAPQSIDSTSSVFGPFTFILDPAPTITLSISAPNGTSGTGTLDDPLVVSSRSFDVTAKAQSSREIQYLALQYDGDTLQSFNGASGQGNTVQYTTNIPGDHLIEAVARDDLGVIGDATPLHLRVAPLAPGTTFTMINSGDWNSAANWHDSQGNTGVPGRSDFAIVGSKSVSLSQGITVNAVSLNGGTISGPGTLEVTGFMTIAAGQISADVNIAAGAVAELINDADIGISGHVVIYGTCKNHGKGGITGIKSGNGALARTIARHIGPNPNGFFDGLLGVINNLGSWLFHRPLPEGQAGSGSAHPPNPALAPEVPRIARKQNAGKVKVSLVSQLPG